jgi:hypothetical protein
MSRSSATAGNSLLREYPWRLSYSTSAHTPEGRPVDILHDFYVPALKRAVQYDRVAGYFRSSSLAAASQGFSAFVAQGGAARMVVGSDLDPVDVQAILAAGEDKLASALNRELARPEQWPEGVQRGVELLAWMLAHGHLEIRVAFRVHADAARPGGGRGPDPAHQARRSVPVRPDTDQCLLRAARQAGPQRAPRALGERLPAPGRARW